jgi:hypothetical protein
MFSGTVIFSMCITDFTTAATTVGKYEKCLHLLSIFFAQKIIPKPKNAGFYCIIYSKYF